MRRFHGSGVIIAQFERQLGAQRTRDSIISAMLNNSKVNGGYTPLGFDLDPEKPGFPKPNPKELKEVETLMQIFTETSSAKETIAEAQKLGIKNKTGKRFSFDSLKRLLMNTKYIGKLSVSHGLKNELETIVDLPHGPLVPLPLFEKVQQTIAEQQDKQGRHNRKGRRVFLLTGLLIHEDGSTYRGVSGTARSGEKVPYYRNEQNSLSIDAVALEKALLKDIRKIIENNEELETHMKQVETKKLSRLDILESSISQVRSDLKKLEIEEQAILPKLQKDAKDSSPKILAWLETQITQMETRKKDLEAREQDLEREKEMLLGRKVDGAKMKKNLSAVFAYWDKATPEKQKALLRELFEKIEISKENQVKYTWKSLLPPVTLEETRSFSGVKWRGGRDSNPRPSA